MATNNNKSIQRPMGRPKAPLGTTRSNRIVTLVTDAELARLQSLAETGGCSLSAMAHRLITRDLFDNQTEGSHE